MLVGTKRHVGQPIIGLQMRCERPQNTGKSATQAQFAILEKKAPDLQAVNHHVLHHLHPEQVEVEIWRADALEVHRGLSSELDEMWSYVRSKANPRWLWHAIDHHTGKVLAYVFGRRQDTVFLALKALLEPFGVVSL